MGWEVEPGATSPPMPPRANDAGRMSRVWPSARPRGGWIEPRARPPSDRQPARWRPDPGPGWMGPPRRIDPEPPTTSRWADAAAGMRGGPGAGLGVGLELLDGPIDARVNHVRPGPERQGGEDSGRVALQGLDHGAERGLIRPNLGPEEPDEDFIQGPLGIAQAGFLVGLAGRIGRTDAGRIGDPTGRSVRFGPDRSAGLR